ncbi:hypothetical protein V1477_017954 [Vespula maculifrons]|uniref:Uncharacterized protein n=1 Tax=Vespula maculifrons TaxID=7453 RepID=A0ABD2B1C6_VESMC
MQMIGIVLALRNSNKIMRFPNSLKYFRDKLEIMIFASMTSSVKVPRQKDVTKGSGTRKENRDKKIIPRSMRQEADVVS